MVFWNHATAILAIGGVGIYDPKRVLRPLMPKHSPQGRRRLSADAGIRTQPRSHPRAAYCAKTRANVRTQVSLFESQLLAPVPSVFLRRLHRERGREREIPRPARVSRVVASRAAQFLGRRACGGVKRRDLLGLAERFAVARRLLVANLRVLKK